MQSGRPWVYDQEAIIDSKRRWMEWDQDYTYRDYFRTLYRINRFRVQANRRGFEGWQKHMPRLEPRLMRHSFLLHAFTDWVESCMQDMAEWQIAIQGTSQEIIDLKSAYAVEYGQIKAMHDYLKAIPDNAMEAAFDARTPPALAPRRRQGRL